MRLLPRTLAGQTVLVLLVGLTVSHLASMWIYSTDRVQVLTQLGGFSVATRVAEITHLVEDTPPDWRERLLRAVDSPSLSVAVTPESMVVPGEHDWQERALEALLAQDLGGRPIVVRLHEPSDSGPTSGLGKTAGWLHMQMMRGVHGWPVGQSLNISIRLEDGSWLNFATAIPRSESLWSSASTLSMVLMTAGVLLVSVWAVRRLTRPLAGFARAAERLGRDVAAPPLEVAGPAEVQRAAEAFNDMQARIRRLVENRTLMLAAISHDLRTPITTLKLRAEFVEDEEERSRMLATLAEMEALVGETLAFARDEAVREERRRVDLVALVASVVDDLTDAGVAVTLTAPAKLACDCRPLALKRVFQNLIENAVKYGEAAEVSIAADDQSITVAVDDRGPGIPESELAKVFTPFYRIEASRSRETGGVGLGLAVALSIVHAHGGELRLANRPEGGLRASVELPR